MNIAQINVNGVIATAKNLMPIPAGLIGATVTFKFEDDVWKSLTKTVCFRGAVPKDVVGAEDIVTIPCEVLAESGRRIAVGVYGTDADKQVVIPTLWAELGFTQYAADPSGDPSTDPALPVWAQLQEKVSEAMDIVKALEDAKDRGEFKGEPGPAGPQGPEGKQGEQGVPGTPGTNGYTPQKGIDYYTDLDKAEMVAAVLTALPNGDEVAY